MIKINKFEQALKITDKNIIRTPLVHSPTISNMFGAEIYLKLENLQKTGSFKIRGAMYKILSQIDKGGSKGVVAASAGNHAQGVALAATRAKLPSTIFMPEWASISKQKATQSYGGKVILSGKTILECLNEAIKMADQGFSFIHPFDDLDIITGQGTISLEIFKELKDIDIILVPIGGGGLISGIACVAKLIKPDIKIIGVQAKVCPSACEAFKKGRIVNVESKASIADGISVKQTGKLNFEFIKKYVDDVVLVEEDQIASAILMLLERKKILAEGAGAVTLAALLNNSVSFPKGAKVVLIISGGNVDSPVLGRIISQGLLKNNRIMHFKVRLGDKPGSLSRLLSLIAVLKANVLHIYHDRNTGDLPLYVADVELELETRGQAHIDKIVKELENSEYKYKIL
ncbi:L-threonine ammonia-lyase [Candidatus Magnetomoraceae bacterium gMMP-15]